MSTSPNTFYAAPLETWADAIQRLSSEAEQYSLEKVEHYKALSNMEHEFLVIYAGHHDPYRPKIVLGVDRNGRDSARALSTLVYPQSLPKSSSSSSSSSSSEKDLAYDGVQFSHDGCAPILAQQGPSILLYTITFSPTSPPLTASNSEARLPPSLLHLSVLLLTIRKRFPRYTFLEYQCYFFARATCLALMDLFGGVETELEGGRRTATWRGMHVLSLQDIILPLPLVLFCAADTTPVGQFLACFNAMVCCCIVMRSEADTRRCR
jgi:hypothetical protein